jgi:rod shape-determining protein MreB and related proteins
MMLSRKIGIDLGTSTLRIYVKGEGIVLSEPSASASDRDSTRTLHRLIGKAQGRPRLFRPEVIMSVPSAVTSTQRRAFTEAAITAGARQVWLIDEPLAAAMGAGLPIGELRASAICEIGAGTTEVAVISLSGMVVARSIPVGGRRFDKAIAEHVLRHLNLELTDRAAEEIKIAVGSAVLMDKPLVHEVGGVQVTSNDVVDAIHEPLREIAHGINAVLAETPPDLAADIGERGLVLSGGAAQLRGLAAFISTQTGIPAVVASEPQTSVVRGTGMALDNFEVLRRNQSYLR